MNSSISFVLAIIVTSIIAVELALYLSTSNQCSSFEEHLYTNGYNGQESPYNICMQKNGYPIIHLTLPSYDIKQPEWNTTRVWIE